MFLSFPARRLAWGSVACLVVAIAACTDLTPPGRQQPSGPGPQVQLDKAGYRWLTDSALRYSVANPDGVPIWARCPSLVVQRYRNGWQSVISVPTECLSPLPRRVLPGDSMAGTLPLTSNVFPRAGNYRLVFDLFRDQGLTDQWPVEHRISETFRVDP